MALFRPGVFDPVPVGESPPETVEVAVEFRPHSLAAVVESRVAAEPAGGPSLEDAEVVVAGGMGLGAAEHFSLAEELAEGWAGW